ncbi:hypothetical protein [Nonomuraea candida]|uniref:hypothetical protein n=1 Tax=Nonomuraea candida TaxID=359159 RepID=UPI0012F9F3A4|nr:hypothetical protein [Nonomuraea candida]
MDPSKMRGMTGGMGLPMFLLLTGRVSVTKASACAVDAFALCVEQFEKISVIHAYYLCN